jgi:cation transport ATPase
MMKPVYDSIESKTRRETVSGKSYSRHTKETLRYRLCWIILKSIPNTMKKHLTRQRKNIITSMKYSKIYWFFLFISYFTGILFFFNAEINKHFESPLFFISVIILNLSVNLILAEKFYLKFLTGKFKNEFFILMISIFISIFVYFYMGYFIAILLIALLFLNPAILIFSFKKIFK